MRARARRGTFFGFEEGFGWRDAESISVPLTALQDFQSPAIFFFPDYFRH